MLAEVFGQISKLCTKFIFDSNSISKVVSESLLGGFQDPKRILKFEVELLIEKAF